MLLSSQRRKIMATIKILDLQADTIYFLWILKNYLRDLADDELYIEGGTAW